MPVKTRSNRSSVSAETVVSDAIARNAKYVGKAPTANLAAFSAFVVEESKDRFGTKAEKDAFVLGNRLAGLRSKYTDDRKNGLIPADTTFETYALETSGVSVPTGKALDALKAGIATYKDYVRFRNARKASADTGE